MNSLEKQREMISRLTAAGISTVDEYTPFPRPFYNDLSRVKAIYLGCDPSNTKNQNRFTHAFALPNGDEYGFGPFVRSHRDSLGQVGLSWETVYVQNLCQNYFTEETSKNLVDWKKAAQMWIQIMKDELEDFGNHIPVLLTSAYLYQVLVPGRKYTPAQFYKCEQSIPIPASENLLERPLIPFYRNRRKVDYHLTNPDWDRYKQSIINYLKNSVHGGEQQGVGEFV